MSSRNVKQLLLVAWYDAFCLFFGKFSSLGISAHVHFMSMEIFAHNMYADIRYDAILLQRNY